MLGSLTNLVELHITYQLKNIKIEYRKDQFQFTNNDAKNLARGLEKCEQLKVLRYLITCKLKVLCRVSNEMYEWKLNITVFTVSG